MTPKDQEIAAFLEASRPKLSQVESSPALLAEGEGLLAALESSVAEHDLALERDREAQGTLKAAHEEAQAELKDFRDTARAFFRTAADHEQLGVRGGLPKDIDKLLRAARVCYARATQEPYKTTFEMYGYDEAGLVTAQATLTTLESARAARVTSLAALKATRSARDVHYRALVRWMRALE